MLRAVAVAIVMLFAFSIAWLISVPLFQFFVSSVKPYVRGTVVEALVSNVEGLIGNLLIWIGVLFFAVVIVWLIIYAFRREVDTFAEYPE